MDIGGFRGRYARLHHSAHARARTGTAHYCARCLASTWWAFEDASTAERRNPFSIWRTLLGSGELHHIMAKQDVLPVFGERQKALMPLERKRNLSTTKITNSALRTPIGRRGVPGAKLEKEKQPLFFTDSHRLYPCSKGTPRLAVNDTAPANQVPTPPFQILPIRLSATHLPSLNNTLLSQYELRVSTSSDRAWYSTLC